jgi:hypothetical protein
MAAFEQSDEHDYSANLVRAALALYAGAGKAPHQEAASYISESPIIAGIAPLTAAEASPLTNPARNAEAQRLPLQAV